MQISQYINQTSSDKQIEQQWKLSIIAAKQGSSLGSLSLLVSFCLPDWCLVLQWGSCLWASLISKCSLNLEHRPIANMPVCNVPMTPSNLLLQMSSIYSVFHWFITAKILPVVRRQHLLLCTLLICNAAAMEVRNMKPLDNFLRYFVDSWELLTCEVTWFYRPFQFF